MSDTFPSIEAVQAMTDAELRALLVSLAGHEQELAALHTAIAAQFVMPADSPTGHRAAGRPYSLAEAAGLLAKSPAWLRRKAKAGHVPGTQKVGRSWMFDRLAFDRWRSRREVA